MVDQNLETQAFIRFEVETLSYIANIYIKRGNMKEYKNYLDKANEKAILLTS